MKALEVDTVSHSATAVVEKFIVDINWRRLQCYSRCTRCNESVMEEWINEDDGKRKTKDGRPVAMVAN